MSDVTPVTFKNRAGQTLIGLVHQPVDSLRKDRGIILLSPGVKTRVAPHRLYKKMAEHYSSMGYPVLRFDFYGLGDSEGEIDETFLADFYGSVAVGRYIEDTLDALDWFENNCGVSKVVFAGLCGGALTGLLVAADDERVEGLISLGMPVVLDSSNVDPSQYITQWKAEQLRSGYIKKIFNFKAWLRLFTLKSDLRVIFKILTQPLFKRFKKFTVAESSEKSQLEKTKLPSNYNTLFTPAFFKMANSSRQMLLIFSGADRLWSEFDEIFVANHRNQLEEYKKHYDIYTIENANHILSDKKWVVDMLNYSKKWLQTHFA